MNSKESVNTKSSSIEREILSKLKPFQSPDRWVSLQQFVVSIVPQITLLWLMHLCFSYSILLTVALAIPASIFVIRLFIIQHDCGHGSFFGSRKANDLMGWFCSLFTFFPYEYWRHQHALHHASTGKLDERGNGDVFLFTVKEYLALSRFEKLKYRLIRHPVTLFLFGPFVLFFLMNRVAWDPGETPARVRLGLYLSNLLVALQIAISVYFLGWQETTAILMPLVFFAGVIGIFLFYVQHQFEHAYWEEGRNWNFFEAAVQGSSFLDLPRFLHWCTGNIGYHHIHHLSPKIPNYKLAESHLSHPSFQEVKRETLFSGIKTLMLGVWDEEQKRLISFGELRRNLRQKPL